MEERHQQVYFASGKNIKNLISDNDKVDDLTKEMLSKGESTEFVGRAVAHLAADPKIMKKSGCVFMTSDLAREYGFKVHVIKCEQGSCPN